VFRAIFTLTTNVAAIMKLNKVLAQAMEVFAYWRV